MEVLPCSSVQCVGQSDCPPQSSAKTSVYDGESSCLEHEKQVQVADGRVEGLFSNVEGPQLGIQGEVQGAVDELHAIKGCQNGPSRVDCQVEGQKSSSASHDFDEDDINAQNYSTEPCLTSLNGHLIVDSRESELLKSSKEGESSLSESNWLESDESLALWVKWRGKWQTGIRCARADCPLSTLRAKPTHDRKKYFVIFFPNTRNYSWADTLLVRPITDYPHPIAYKTHKVGLKMVKDLTVARRFIMQKLAVGMLNIVDQFHTEALIETARDVAVWKEFAMEVSRCNGYSDLGKMLLKLQSMILQSFINSDWLQNSYQSWLHRCQKASSAETVEILKEELVESILWNEVQSLQNAPLQPTLGSGWKTWKHEVMKWFSTSHPVPNAVDFQQRSSDGPLTTTLQVGRKRPKLEVRRPEAHASQVESRVSDEAIAIEIDSEFFNNRETENASTLASESYKEEDMKDVAPPTDIPIGVTDKWGGLVVETGNSEFIQTKDVEITPVNEVVGIRSFDPGSKNRQCIAYIESKGRQCVRWANDGDVYCCVHLSSRFTGNSTKTEGSRSSDTPMCEGTTVLGTKCKHRSLYGSSFCKKHGPRDDMKTILNFPQNTLKRKYEENISGSEAMNCREMVLVGDAESPLQVDPVSVMAGNAFGERESLFEQSMIPAKVGGHMGELRCIDSCLGDNSNPCLEGPKRHSLYCEKHLPSWLKRARNGKSRIISKEVFIDVLKDCHSQEQKVHLHQACELFYKLFKSILSLRNPVPKDVQFQWALSEASKNVGVGEIFTKLVCSEKERLGRIWGFNADEDACVLSSAVQEKALVLWSANDNDDSEKAIKCKICSQEFLDDQALGTHWMDGHKKEAQWFFRGYACAICLDSFTNRKVLESHVQERHRVPFVEQCMLIQCIPCGSHFGNTEELWLHVLAVHPDNFKPSKAAEPVLSAGEDSQGKFELSNSALVVNNSANVSGRRFVCRFCGLKFDLLPDLGRHHQAAHMGPSLVSSRPSKRGIRYYPYRSKSGRLSRPRLKSSLAAASYRIRNRANATMKKRIQASKSLGSGGIHVQNYGPETVSLCRLEESHCSAVARILFSEMQKTKRRPNNLDILSVARSACCKISLEGLLEGKYGILPKSLYLKAAKLCSEYNIQVDWHQEGFICPKGCKVSKESLLSPLLPLPIGIVGYRPLSSSDRQDNKWEMDEGHYIIDAIQLDLRSSQLVLCDDISLGQELVSVVCVADERHLDSYPVLSGSSNDQNAGHSMPWESFTYITKPLLHQSLGLDTESLQLGCACPLSTCCPETCDHVYLFDNDYDDAKDIYGKSMHGRFAYDGKGRIILEEGYLVYECNQMCSCNRACRNRVLQNGVRVKLEVFKTDKKGWAVRAGQPIMRGTFVCEYIGEVIDENEAQERRIRYGKDDCSYLYEIDGHINDMSRLVEGQAHYVIDSTNYGNVSRFINHSCLPNLVNHQVLVESMDSQRAHIGLYANRDIAFGEELTYNYRYKRVPGEGYPCHCGASTCQGRLY